MRGKGVDEAWNVLEDMQRHGLSTDKYTVSRMLMKTVGDGKSRLNSARVYRSISIVEKFIDSQPKDVDEVLFNALLDTCCRLKDFARVEATVARMRCLQVTPSPVTLGILVKTYGQSGDIQKVLQVWDEMDKQRVQANAVTYGCMIDACVKCGNLSKALSIFQGMRDEGKHKNTILYTTLIKGHGLDKDLKSALELFREMPREGVPYNTITFNSIIDACVRCNDLQAAEALLREICESDSTVSPDLITFSTMLKGYCYVGDLDKALHVVEAIKARGLRCDEMVYNTLLDGCVKSNDVPLGLGLFEEMLQNKMRPSAITHSILLRLYQRIGSEENAGDAVNQLYEEQCIERPHGSDRVRGAGGRKWGQRTLGGARACVQSCQLHASVSPSSFDGHCGELESPSALDNQATVQSLSSASVESLVFRGASLPACFHIDTSARTAPPLHGFPGAHVGTTSVVGARDGCESVVAHCGTAVCGLLPHSTQQGTDSNQLSIASDVASNMHQLRAQPTLPLLVRELQESSEARCLHEQQQQQQQQLALQQLQLLNYQQVQLQHAQLSQHQQAQQMQAAHFTHSATTMQQQTVQQQQQQLAYVVIWPANACDNFTVSAQALAMPSVAGTAPCVVGSSTANASGCNGAIANLYPEAYFESWAGSAPMVPGGSLMRR
jgi:pentatricopeptide repeat protein